MNKIRYFWLYNLLFFIDSIVRCSWQFMDSWNGARRPEDYCTHTSAMHAFGTGLDKTCFTDTSGLCTLGYTCYCNTNWELSVLQGFPHGHSGVEIIQFLLFLWTVLFALAGTYKLALAQLNALPHRQVFVLRRCVRQGCTALCLYLH